MSGYRPAGPGINARLRVVRLLQAHRDVLGLQVLADSLEAALATEARLLDPSERSGGVRDDALVETDHPRLQALADAERALQVTRVDVGDETVLGEVGGGQRLLLGGERGDRGDRAEDLLAQQARVLGHAG